jgi:molybdopterin-guanine dinucleotide biosynthesis protein A
MGRDKARLPFRGASLAEFVACTVAEAAGSAVLVGDPDLYGALAYPVIPDLYPGEGPLGAIITALSHTAADWNLVVACDMPGLSTGFLRRLLEAAEQRAAAALIPAGPTGRPEPLCAVYHRRGLEKIEAAFRGGERKVTGALRTLPVESLSVEEVAVFQNVNTPEDWAGYARE